MKDLIQSLPSLLHTTGNYSHMDGEIIDGLWRGVGDDNGDDLPPPEVNLRPGRVPEQELLENHSGVVRLGSGATYTRKGVWSRANRARGDQWP